MARKEFLFIDSFLEESFRGIFLYPLSKWCVQKVCLTLIYPLTWDLAQGSGGASRPNLHLSAYSLEAWWSRILSFLLLVSPSYLNLLGVKHYMWIWLGSLRSAVALMRTRSIISFSGRVRLFIFCSCYMLNVWSYLQFDRFDEAKQTIKVVVYINGGFEPLFFRHF